MDLNSLHTQLRQKQLTNFYIFSGPEWAVQRIYINQISSISGKKLQYVDKFADIYGKLKNPGIVKTKNVYVIRDDKDIISEEKVQEQIKNGVLSGNILILLLTNVDKRTKFYKAYKDMIVEFEPLKPAILKKYLQKEIELSDRNYDILMEVCEYDYGRCLLEIDKIKRTQIMGLSDTAFEQLLEDGTIYQPPRDAIFQFVDAVLDRDVNEAYQLYTECLAVGEAVMVMLTVLYNNTKAVLQIQSCPGNDIAKTTGLTGWQIKNAKPHCGNYRIGELLYLMELIQKCEKSIKTGTIEEPYVMDYILTSVM